MTDIYVLYQYGTSEGIILYFRCDKCGTTWSQRIVLTIVKFPDCVNSPFEDFLQNSTQHKNSVPNSRNINIKNTNLLIIETLSKCYISWYIYV
jgi:hypothetical protein